MFVEEYTKFLAVSVINALVILLVFHIIKVMGIIAPNTMTPQSAMALALISIFMLDIVVYAVKFVFEKAKGK